MGLNESESVSLTCVYCFLGCSSREEQDHGISKLGFHASSLWGISYSRYRHGGKDDR